MKPYTAFSNVYDHLLNHVNYELWYRYIRSLMLRYFESPGTILEIGCGTGKFGAKFSRDNFLIYGMDKSLDMLEVAKTRAYKNFRIFCGDITRFSLSKKIDFIFSIHDTINYLLSFDELKNAFRSVRDIMHHESIFMFDLTTEYNIRQNFDGQTSNYRTRGIDIEWSNEYDEKEKLIYSFLKFQKDGECIATEEHIQRIYSVEEMKDILKKEGFELVDVFSDYSFNTVKKDAVMINFVTKKS